VEDFVRVMREGTAIFAEWQCIDNETWVMIADERRCEGEPPKTAVDLALDDLLI
jgi:hypothetical protein